MFVAPTSSPGEITAPEGYILHPLLPCHVELITQHWARDVGCKKLDMQDADIGWVVFMITSNIIEMPRFGIFSDGSDAWLCNVCILRWKYWDSAVCMS